MSRFGISLLKEARRAGVSGVTVPTMDIFQRLEVRCLWLAGTLKLRGHLTEGCRVVLTEEGKRFVDARLGDWS